MRTRNPFKRSVGVPAEVLVHARLHRGERVLAGACAKDGSWLLGTGDALLVLAPIPVVEPVETPPPVEPVETLPPVEPVPLVEPVETSPPVETRIPWEQVERADWERDAKILRVVEVGQFGQARPEYAFEIEDPGLFLQLVRERVTASVVLQRRVVVSGEKGLLVIARRPPRGDGEITWAYEFDSGMDPEDPKVMEAAEDALRSAEEELGL